MKIILLKDVPKIGRRFEVKNVSDGHAINMLIPRGLAVSATPDAVRRLEAQRNMVEGEREIQKDLILKNLDDLDGKVLTVYGKASESGHLFAGLHREAIAAELQKQTGLQIDPSFLLMEHSIKEVGEHAIHASREGKSVKFTVIVQTA